MATVQTVTGPIEASALGTTLIHEHLAARDDALMMQFPHLGTVREGPVEAVSWEGAEAAACEAASAAVERDVKTICDPSAMFLGRDVHLMKRVSDATRLQIVPCTGIYTYDYLPVPLVSRDADAIADLFVHDIEQGIQGTDIKAAFIKCAADEPGVTENVEKIHRAAARASVRTGGTPIMAHSRPASNTGPRQVEIFEEEGADLSRVQIAHTGDSADVSYAEGLLEKGVFIGMDRYGIEMYLPFAQRQETTLALLEKGYERQMFLAADSCATIDWFPVEMVEQMTGAGAVKDWSIKMVPDIVLPELRERGMTEDQERTMTVDNAVRWLTGEDV